MRAVRILLAVVLFGAAAVRWEPSVTAQTGVLTLGLTVNTATITPGDTLVAGVTVNNPGNGPLADFYFVIMLPDGATVVSAGPGVGARFGSIGNLRSLVPVVRGISLASPFPYQAGSFFSYTFNGTEPLGRYRLYFVATRTGAFNDGVIGPGDLLAVASQDVTVANSPVLVDTVRTVTRSIAPSGGVVQTTSANGTLLTLTLPAGAVSVATPIAIAPLVAFQGRPAPIVAGISAGPSGLRLSPPATLTVTLPPGFQSSGFGLRGVIADDRGQNLEFVPVSRVGNVVTMTVPHFSVAAIEVLLDFDDVPCRNDGTFPFPPEQSAACAAIDPLADAEAVRLARDGGPISQTFKDALVPILNTWLTNGLLPRLLDAQTPIPGQPFEKRLDMSDEWGDFIEMYEPLFGLADRINAAGGRPLGATVDLAQERFRLALIAAMNAANIQCLAQKSDVDRIVFGVWLLELAWNGQFAEPPATAPFDLSYCVDIRIDAAPPPVLTPGQAAQFPVDVRLRFTDGVELPGRQAVVTVTATNGTITPAGGVVTLPLATNLTLLPTAPGGTVTITAAMAAGAAGEVTDLLPVRTRTFEAGQPAPVLTFTGTAMFSRVRLTGQLAAETTVVQASASFESGTATNAVLPSTTVGGAVGYTGAGSSTATRTVTSAAGSVTLGFAAQAQASLARAGNFVGSADVSGSGGDQWCVNLPVRFDLEPAFVGDVATVTFQNPLVGTVIDLRSSGTVRLPTGRWCLSFSGQVVRSLSNGVLSGNTSGSFGYALTFRPVP